MRFRGNDGLVHSVALGHDESPTVTLGSILSSCGAWHSGAVFINNKTTGHVTCLRCAGGRWS